MDLVERQSEWDNDLHRLGFERGYKAAQTEAAEEIRRLQELLQMSYPEHMAEIERLRTALHEIVWHDPKSPAAATARHVLKDAALARPQQRED